MSSARLARRWQEAGGDYAQMAEALNDEITVELATKSDLRALEAVVKSEFAEVRTEIAEVKTELGTEIAGVRTEIAGVRTEIAATGGRLETRIEQVRAEMIKWVGGMMVVQALAIVGLVRLLFVE